MNRLLLATCRLPLSLLSVLAALIAAPAAQATVYYWDVNGTTSGFSTVVGTWGTNLWNTDIIGGTGGTTTATTLNVDDLNIVAATTNTGTIAVSGAQVARSITYGSTVGAVTISGGTSLTLGDGVGGGGITVNSGAGAQIISTAIILNGSQTWTNNSVNTFTTNGGLNLGANTLTFSGSGNISFGTVAASVISNGSIVMNGTGLLQLGGAATVPVHTYSGGTTITNGTVMFSGNLPASGNLTLNGGVYQEYFGGTVTRALGSGSGQIQITGGASGFSGQGGTGTNFNIGGAAATLVWGSAFFNPSTLILQAANAGVNTNGKMTLTNGINLSGSDRIIASNQTTDGVATSGATIAGVISNSTGTAGFEKTGVGNLILSNAANTFNGALTITGGWITAAGSGSLGSGVATNTLIFNGGTLRASAAITSPAARGVTMTATGIIDTNTFAVSIAGNIGGAGGLTKNSTGTLTLSGTNSYGGVTTVNAGTLAITKEASLASNTAANMNVKSGAGLALNVDTAGSAGFTVANLNALLGNISVANTAAQGLQAGAILSLDTATASGATFTQGNAITNSTGAFGGAIGLTKLGAGTLVLDKANTYTGPTTITGGTLQLNVGGVIATPIGNNATFAINSAGAVTQGTHFGLIGGSGAVTNTGAGTLTLNLANTYTGSTTVSNGTIAITNVLAMQNSAYNTAGSNGTTIGLDVTSGLSSGTLTLGGLAGSVDLASAFTAGFTGTVTNLILNPQTGITSTYGGVIANGAMSLTKTGAGTQILTGANTYTGATIVNAGTLTVGSGATGSLSSSSSLQMGGSIFNYSRTGAGQTVAGLTVNAGNSTVNNTSAGQTLTLSGITRTASIFGTVNFASLTGPISTTTGNVNSIIGPWATTGSTTTLRYAVGSPDGITATGITAFTGTTATATTLANVTDAAVNYEYSAAATTASNLTANTLRYSGAATTTAIGATNTLTLNGLMNAGSAGPLLISGGPTTGGILIGSTGELVITANAQGTTISTAIGGTGRLVYNGAGSRLLLSSATSAYSGGTVINSGQLAIASDAALGLSTGSITLNGGSLLGNNTNPQVGNAGGVNITSARDVIVGVAGGSIGAHGNNNFTTTGILSGSGTLTFLELGGAGGRSLNFNSTANTFTGRIVIPSIEQTLSVNSLVDTAGSGNIALNLSAATTNTGSTFAYGAGATAPLTLNNRAFELNASGAFTGTIQNNNTTQAISIGSTLIATGAGAKTLVLGAVAGPTNVFSGSITNGTGGGTVAVSKNGVGTWQLSGNNSYTGQTTVSNNGLLILSGDNIGMTGGVTLSAGTSLVPKLHINSATALGTGTLNFGGGAASDTVQIDNTSAGAVTVSTANAITMNRNFTFVGTQDLSLGTGTTTLGGMTTGSSRIITVTAKTLTLNGPIVEATPGNNNGITKAGAGTLVLSGPGNSYTGATTVSAGTLVGIGANAFGSTSGISIAAASSATLSLLGDSSTNFVKTSDSSLYAVTTTANGATINVDQATIAGTGAKTMTIGTLALNNAVTNGTFFTGFNNTSLSIGAVTTSAAAGGTETLTNNIASTGTLTLASLAVARTSGTQPTVVFNGTGNTTVTGNITQVVTTKLTKEGAGTLTLNGTNSYTGITTITAGVVEAAVLADGSSNSSIGASSNAAASLVFGAPTATLRYIGGSNVTIDRGFTLSSGVGGGATIESSGLGTLSFDNTIAINYGTTAQTRTLTLGGTNIGNNTFGKVIANNTGGTNATSLVKTGVGKWVLDQANTYTGGTTITSGTLMLGSGGTTGSLSSSGSITNNGVLHFNRSDTITQGTAFGSLITGSGKIVQSGSGTTILTGTNDFTGSTDILAGTLEATAVDALKSTSTINISGGTLLVSGTGNRINDAAGMVVTTNSTSVAALSLSGTVTESVGALTLNSAGTSVVDLGTGTAVFTFANSSGPSWSGLMQIWNWSGSLSGGGTDQLFFGSSTAGLTPSQLASITFVDPAGLGSGSYGAQLLSNGELVPVPEPSSLFACAVILGIVGLQRRRRTASDMT